MGNGDVHALRFLEQQFKQTTVANTENRLPELDELIKSIARINSFVVLYNFQKEQYIFHHRVTEFTGYQPEEFTIDAVRNAPISPIKMIHPDDISHKSRYEMVLFKMVMEDIKIKPLSEHTDTQFRFFKKDGTIIKVNRQSYIFQTLKDGTPVSLLEIWKIIPAMDDYVKIIMYAEDARVYDFFYKINSKILGFHITDRHKEIISLRNRRKDNSQIAEILNISQKTVENHIRKIKQNILHFYNTNNIDEPLNNMADVLHFVKTYNIFTL